MMSGGYCAVDGFPAYSGIHISKSLGPTLIFSEQQILVKSLQVKRLFVTKLIYVFVLTT